jgi:hypothetical protein
VLPARIYLRPERLLLSDHATMRNGTQPVVLPDRNRLRNPGNRRVRLLSAGAALRSARNASDLLSARNDMCQWPVHRMPARSNLQPSGNDAPGLLSRWKHLRDDADRRDDLLPSRADLRQQRGSPYMLPAWNDLRQWRVRRMPAGKALQ